MTQKRKGRPPKVQQRVENQIKEPEKNDQIKPENEIDKKESEIKDDPNLPKKSLFRIDEVAAYFDTTEQTIRNWRDHGHIRQEKIVGVARFSRDSILRCRFRKVNIGSSRI